MVLQVSDAPDLSPIRKLYEDGLDRHGVASPAVGWRDEAGHRLRFAKLATVIDAASGPASVNDLGCGYGAFHEYLVETGVAPAHFRGYDISARMVAEARKRVPGAEFREGSAIEAMADYSFACGIFNVRLTESEADWLAHIERTLDNLHAFSTRGFAFNLLSTYVDYREPHLFYGDPCHFFDLCKRRYARKVALLHDYPLYEWTIAVTRS